MCTRLLVVLDTCNDKTRWRVDFHSFSETRIIIFGVPKDNNAGPACDLFVIQHNNANTPLQLSSREKPQAKKGLELGVRLILQERDANISSETTNIVRDHAENTMRPTLPQTAKNGTSISSARRDGDRSGGQLPLVPET